MVQNDRKKQPAGNWNMHESGLLLTVIKFTITHQIISDLMSSLCIFFAFPQATKDSCRHELYQNLKKVILKVWHRRHQQ